jgi:hypothetical protein
MALSSGRLARSETLLRHVEALFPEVARHFRNLATAIGTPAEKRRIREIYRELPSLNFSKDILEKISANFPGTASVLPVLQVTWSDWGSPHRLTEAKRAIERRIHRTTQPQPLPLPAHSAAPPKTAEIMPPHRRGGLVVSSAR